jgi:hypothetical protein
MGDVRPTNMPWDILGFAFAMAFGVWIFSFVVRAARTGRIHHTDSTSTFAFRTQPIRFTFVTVLFVVFSAALFYVAILRAIAIWRALAA